MVFVHIQHHLLLRHHLRDWRHDHWLEDVAVGSAAHCLVVSDVAGDGRTTWRPSYRLRLSGRMRRVRIWTSQTRRLKRNSYATDVDVAEQKVV